MADLIITNGDSAADLMREARFDADILPWRDVLFEGPVPHADSLENLSALRAPFLAKAFDTPLNEVANDMAERDRTMRELDRYDRVTLWFEHDLYDQLQLLQILDFFHGEANDASLHLVQADDYLGRQSPSTITHLEALAVPVSGEQKTLAARTFDAFRLPTPLELSCFLDADLAPLPHMKATLARLFEELPGSVDGLSRTQRQALTLIDDKKLPPKRLFGAAQAMEDAIFMGDWSFWRTIEELAFNEVPLIEGLPSRFSTSLSDAERQAYLEAPLTLTDSGRAVLAGQGDHASLNRIDRWLGGTPINGDRIWRWNRNSGSLQPPEAG